MEFYTKDEIANADDTVYENVLIPEWGNKYVRLKSLTGTERDKYEGDSVIQKGGSTKMNLVNMRARLLSLVIVDGDGRRMFTDSEVHKLGKKNANVLERLFDKAREMNGMTEKDVEELSEGFSSDPSEDSTSV